ncbi:M23 family metallopeptidase [Cephaloticoccus primus]|uniref:M23 family metallopeptidase n=1 Tax=Cephaloticoccus primus TaxID=1548207 RepID=UPI0009EDE9E7|nr:M23 family metallopeptidase [Cephaloticoccus primus]
MRRLLICLACVCGLFSGAAALAADSGNHSVTPLELHWPTPHPAWAQGRPSRDFLQPTVSGNPLSGSYGSVRNGGTRFHEGIDIKPLRRDAAGLPLDPVFAAMSGVVRHVNAQPEHSSYGRYVVLEHPAHSPAVYTLYAHLASVAADIRPGALVAGGQVLGRMGRSAGGYVIPASRAHLHFEIGLRLSDAFPAWYASRGFDSPNHHGLYNGMNLMGFDPLAFFEAQRAGRIVTMSDWFAQMQPAVSLRIATRATPDFVRRYPALVRGQGRGGAASGSRLGEQAGWQIDLDPSGIPFRWTPLSAAQLGARSEGEMQIASVNEALLATQPAKQLVQRQRGEWRPGRDLISLRELLFGPSKPATPPTTHSTSTTAAPAPPKRDQP